MNKIIPVFLLVIVVAISVGVYYVLTNLDALVKAAIEQHGSEATQTSVRVDKVKIDLTDGAGGISGLTIANPSGYQMPLAFSLAEVRVAIDLQSLQEEPYIISEITVLAPQVFVEINKDNRTNLNELKKNLVPSTPATPSTEAREAKQQAPTEPATAAEPRLIIQRITFADGDIMARVAALDNKEYKLKLPSLDMANLGGSNGATASELAREIIKRLTDSASAEVKKKIIDQQLDELKAKAREKLDAEKAKLKQEADSKIDEQKDKAKDKLKGLFK